jgi:aldose sugar dehydrogenase
VRHVIVLTAALAALGLIGACGDDPTPGGAGSPPDSSESESASPSPSAEPTEPSEGEDGKAPPRSGAPAPRIAGTIATGLSSPWGLAFLPDGSALIAERDTGRIRRIADNSVTTVGTVADAEGSGEGGLLGLAVDPDFPTRPIVYAYFTAGDENRIVAMSYARGRLRVGRTLLDGIPASGVHNGGRMVFGPDGYLYVGTGDGSDGDNSQDRDSLGGKILRITSSGAPAPGNPFRGSPVWSYGHRNVQGLAFDDDGRLWASEFGQNTWDEINLIRKGRNYGWPEAEGTAGEGGFTDPVAQWRPTEASPSGLAYADGALWMASLRGERLWRIQIDGGRVVGRPRAFFTGDLGRLRTVAPVAGGGLWLITSNTDGRGDPRDDDDRILRLSLTR